jgi:hypothetical protein
MHWMHSWLTDLHFTKFPFSGISQHIFDSGYWDVLKQCLWKNLTHVSLELPKTSSEIQRQLVEYFNIELWRDFAHKKRLLNTRYGIQIIYFLTSDELTQIHEEVSTICRNILRMVQQSRSRKDTPQTCQPTHRILETVLPTQRLWTTSMEVNSKSSYLLWKQMSCRHFQIYIKSEDPS